MYSLDFTQSSVLFDLGRIASRVDIKIERLKIDTILGCGKTFVPVLFRTDRHLSCFIRSDKIRVWA